MHGDKCHFRHFEAEGKSKNKSNKGVAKGSVAMLKESTQLGRVSKILIQENLFYVNLECWDQSTPSNSPKAPDTEKKTGKKGSIARDYAKV